MKPQSIAPQSVGPATPGTARFQPSAELPVQLADEVTSLSTAAGSILPAIMRNRARIWAGLTVGMALPGIAIFALPPPGGWLYSASGTFTQLTIRPGLLSTAITRGDHGVLTVLSIALVALWVMALVWVCLLWISSLRLAKTLGPTEFGWFRPSGIPGSDDSYSRLQGSTICVAQPMRLNDIVGTPSAEVVVYQRFGDRAWCLVGLNGNLVYATSPAYRFLTRWWRLGGQPMAGKQEDIFRVNGEVGSILTAIQRQTDGHSRTRMESITASIKRAERAAAEEQRQREAYEQQRKQKEQAAQPKETARGPSPPQAPPSPLPRMLSDPFGVKRHIPPQPQRTEAERQVDAKQQVELSLILLRDKIAVSESAWDILSANLRAFYLDDPSSPRAILLSGPPGTGKTTIAKAIGEFAGCAFFPRTIADLKKGHLGHGAQAAKDLWKEAGAAGRAIIFLDECESIFASRGGSDSDVITKEVLGVFLPYLDGVEKSGRVLFIGATNIPDIIDTAILSRFDVTLTIPAPGAKQRRHIIVNCLKKYELPEAIADRLVEPTEGMNGRDLDSIIRRLRQESLAGKTIEESLETLIRSRRLQGNAQTKQGLTWEDVVIPDVIKETLQGYVARLKNRERLQAALGSDFMPRGVLLYGPPGTGKTQIARVMAQTAQIAFFVATTADLKAGYIGQSGQRVKELFSKARSSSPCILFIDELDIITPGRGSTNDYITQEIIGQMLQEIDGIRSQAGAVFLMAASNVPDAIDAAILSRFTERIEIGLPDAALRVQIALAILRTTPVNGSREAVAEAIALRTEGKSGRDIQTLITKAISRVADRAINHPNRDIGLEVEDLPST